MRLTVFEEKEEEGADSAADDSASVARSVRAKKGKKAADDDVNSGASATAAVKAKKGKKSSAKPPKELSRSEASAAKKATENADDDGEESDGPGLTSASARRNSKKRKTEGELDNNTPAISEEAARKAAKKTKAAVDTAAAADDSTVRKGKSSLNRGKKAADDNADGGARATGAVKAKEDKKMDDRNPHTSRRMRSTAIALSKGLCVTSVGRSIATQEELEVRLQISHRQAERHIPNCLERLWKGDISSATTNE